jgi:putative SbcD/Mre11-related phosphoesterase
MIPQPIPNETALFIKEKHLLIVADLHIGIESDLQENGLHIPSQTPHMTRRLLTLIDTYHPQTLIILGDVKHTIPNITIQERIDVKHFLTTIATNLPTHIIPGNHDGNLSWLLPSNTTLHPSGGYILDSLGFLHGHTWPHEDLLHCNYIILGHTHPTVKLTDRLGFSSYEPCWVKGHLNNILIKEHFPTAKNPTILITPAFNPLCGGVAINDETPLGPLIKLLEPSKTELFLLDGTALGTINSLQTKNTNH